MIYPSHFENKNPLTATYSISDVTLVTDNTELVKLSMYKSHVGTLYKNGLSVISVTDGTPSRSHFHARNTQLILLGAQRKTRDYRDE